MKRRLCLTIMTIGMGMCLLTGCGNKQTEESIEGTESITVESAFDFNVEDYVKLGEYKNLSVQYPIPTITSEDVELYAMELVDEYTEYIDVTNRPAANGDYVNIDFVGTMNGKEFEGGSAEDYEFILGDGEFLEEFENNIIGKSVGENTVFKMTFPEDYDEELGGKEAEFTIKINSISEVVVPEYNDAFVAEVTEYDTMAAYEESIEEELMISSQEESALVAGEDALLLAVENATVEGYPQTLYDICYDENLVIYQSYAEMFGMEFEEFMSDFMDGENLADITASAMDEILVCQAIAQKEGFEIKEDSFEEEAGELAIEYGYDTLADFIAEYGEVSVRTALLREKTVQFLYENANVEEVSEDEYYGEDEYFEDTEYIEEE